MGKTTSNKETTSWIVILFYRLDFLLPIFVKLLFEYSYINQYAPLFGYLGVRYSPNYGKMWVSWIPVVVFMIIRKWGRKTKLITLFNVLFFISAIPSFSIYWLRNENGQAFLWITIYWTIWWIISFIISNKAKNKAYENDRNSFCAGNGSFLFSLIYLIVVLTTLYMSIRYGDMRLFIDFYDVYSYRLAENNSMSSIMSYIFAWNTNFLLPFFLGAHFLQNKRGLFIFDIVLLMLCYGIYGNKSMLFSIALVLGLIVLYWLNGLKYTDSMIAAFIVVYLMVTICSSNIMFIALGDRVLEGPAAGHYNYYDFFTEPNHPYLYLRDSILRFFTDSPYTQTVSRIIGSSSKYYSGAYNNMNNGLFSTAFAEFGHFGVVLQPIVIVLVYEINLKIIRKYDDLIQYILILIHALYLQSTSFFSWLLTGGLILEMVVMYLLQNSRIRLKY